MNGKRLFTTLFLVLVLFLLGACAPAPVTTASPEPEATTEPTEEVDEETEAVVEPEPTEELMPEFAGGTLVVAVSNDPGSFNPGITTGFDVHVIADSIFNGLVALDGNANPVPDLATSWEVSDDAKVYTFHLAEGVTWHDGTPFTSADVKFTFENILLNFHSRTKAGLENVLASIETPDENTVVFTFNGPYAPLLQRLDVTEAPILPMHIYSDVEDPTQAEANLSPIGTGPFMWDSYTPGVEVRLVRNPNYFKPGLPQADEVVFRIIPDASTQLQALEAGEVDYIWSIPGPDEPRIADSPDTDILKASSGPGGGFCIMTMTFNLEREVFQHLEVRQAFTHAIDRQQILDQVIFGQGKVAVAPINSSISWAHLSDGPSYEYNPGLAEELLDAAGYLRGDDGVRFTVDFVHFPSFSKYGEVLREQLAAVGIALELRPLERDVTVDVVFNQRDFDTNIISYCNNTDPEIGVRRMYVSDNIGPIPFSNGAAYVNPDIDALFAEAAATADLEARGEIYRQIQEILLDDLPYWWIVETDSSRGIRSACHGFKPWTGHFVEAAYCDDN
ncbi:MAG TPA: ABC transporter substrate-binding protein [Anaerolineales bacterium]|nr:ABC transporter substrate-binding protein [Anaerolineales bacterium]